jgi:hypothetical protein
MKKIVALAMMFAFVASTVVFVPNAQAKKAKKAKPALYGEIYMKKMPKK